MDVVRSSNDVLEMLAHYYGMVGIDNDGDGLVDEDPWGDANNDGILDDDGDCLSLASEYQDSNGDGNPCGPGDLGVDEDFSEQQLTDLVNTEKSISYQCSMLMETVTIVKNTVVKMHGKHVLPVDGERIYETIP